MSVTYKTGEIPKPGDIIVGDNGDRIRMLYVGANGLGWSKLDGSAGGGGLVASQWSLESRFDRGQRTWRDRLQTESEATAEAVAAWEGRLRQSMDAIRAATVVASVNMDSLIALAQLGRAEHDRQEQRIAELERSLVTSSHRATDLDRIAELEALLDGDARKLSAAAGAQYAASAARIAEIEAKVVEWEGAYNSLLAQWDAARESSRLACPDCGKHLSPLGGEE